MHIGGLCNKKGCHNNQSGATMKAALCSRGNNNKDRALGLIDTSKTAKDQKL